MTTTIAGYNIDLESIKAVALDVLNNPMAYLEGARSGSGALVNGIKETAIKTVLGFSKEQQIGLCIAGSLLLTVVVIGLTIKSCLNSRSISLTQEQKDVVNKFGLNPKADVIKRGGKLFFSESGLQAVKTGGKNVADMLKELNGSGKAKTDASSDTSGDAKEGKKKDKKVKTN